MAVGLQELCLLCGSGGAPASMLRTGPWERHAPIMAVYMLCRWSAMASKLHDMPAGNCVCGPSCYLLAWPLGSMLSQLRVHFILFICTSVAGFDELCTRTYVNDLCNRKELMIMYATGEILV